MPICRDRLGLVETLRLQIVHQIVGVVRHGVTARAARLSGEELLPAQLGRRRLPRVTLPNVNGGTNFGKVTAQSNSPRQMQFGLKVISDLRIAIATILAGAGQ